MHFSFGPTSFMKSDRPVHPKTPCRFSYIRVVGLGLDLVDEHPEIQCARPTKHPHCKADVCTTITIRPI